MPPRSEIYQERLAGYLLLRAKPTLSHAQGSTYLPFEGQAWFPIDVDSGTKDSPIDVEWWTYLHEHPGDWTDGAPSVATNRVDPKVFTCCICWDTLRKPVVPLCMHIFCYKCLHRWLKQGRTSCPVCRTPIGEAPIRDNAFEIELRDAIGEGVVTAAASRGNEGAGYDWSGITFA
ncbi:hypothetical protein C8R47DRAFT_1226210 [Mycena vitilis]|nr:hypothetical protein C8R47DRAFT_1226210 [Mycena vitilis]